MVRPFQVTLDCNDRDHKLMYARSITPNNTAVLAPIPNEIRAKWSPAQEEDATPHISRSTQQVLENIHGLVPGRVYTMIRYNRDLSWTKQWHLSHVAERRRRFPTYTAVLDM